MKIKHKKRFHQSFPLWQNMRMFKLQRITPDVEYIEYEWNVKFTDSCYYDMEGEDRLDWSKVCGISMSPIWRATKNSAMVGWRNNDGQLQVIPYMNGPYGDHFFVAEHARNIDSDEWINLKIRINFHLGRIGVYINGEAFMYDAVIPYSKYVREINSWFGGNKKAPCKMLYYKEARLITINKLETLGNFVTI